MEGEGGEVLPPSRSPKPCSSPIESDHFHHHQENISEPHSFQHTYHPLNSCIRYIYAVAIMNTVRLALSIFSDSQLTALRSNQSSTSQLHAAATALTALDPTSHKLILMQRQLRLGDAHRRRWRGLLLCEEIHQCRPCAESRSRPAKARTPIPARASARPPRRDVVKPYHFAQCRSQLEHDCAEEHERQGSVGRRD